MASTPDTGPLERELAELKERVENLELKVEGITVLEPRVEALERTQSAHQARLDHMNKVVMAIQVDVQKLTKQVASYDERQSKKLDEISAKQDTLLALLQPKATL